MDTLLLPVMHEDQLISDALTRMRQLARSGILVEDDTEKLWAVKAAALILARNDNRTQLSEVSSRAPVQLLSTDHATNYQLDLVRPSRTWAQFERLLDAEKSDYLCLAVIGDSLLDATGQPSYGMFATIITRHEDKKAELSSPGDCYCTGPRQHAFPPPQAKAGSACPQGDGATIVCA